MHQQAERTTNNEQRRTNVVSIGEVLVDFIGDDEHHLEGASSFLAIPGGAPANVAIAASRLGASAALIAAVGDDAFGRRLRGVLEENGIDMRGIQTVKERTTLAFVAGESGGIPDYLFYRGADATLSAEHVAPEVTEHAGALYATSMALLGDPARTAVMSAVMQARSAGALVAFDPNLRPSSWPSIAAAREAIYPILERADIVKLSDEEALLLSGLPNLDAAMNALSNTRRLLVVTRGASGCIWSWRQTSGTCESPAVDVVDTIGAGDAFMAALLVRLGDLGYSGGRFWTLRRDDLEDALRFASAAGALTCTRRGAINALPTREDVERLV